MTKFYRCPICGNIIEIIGEKHADLVCCGKVMEKLIPGEVDASLEKHVPVYEVLDNEVVVTIGEALHPMEEDHYIEWIELVTENKVFRTYLKPNDEPKAIFPYEKNSMVFAYCNKHGLWKTDID